MRNLFLFLVLSSLSVLSYANYDANFQGEVTEVLTYADSDNVLIRVSGRPTSHPICTRFDYIVIDGSIPEARRQAMLSRVLLAYSTGEVINIGYDSKDECIGSRIKVYRIG